MNEEPKSSNCYHLVHEFIYRCPYCKTVGMSSLHHKAVCIQCNKICKLCWMPDMNNESHEFVKEAAKTGIIPPKSISWLQFIYRNCSNHEFLFEGTCDTPIFVTKLAKQD